MKGVNIAFSISDSSGTPITNLEPLMAAGGHSVIISSDLREFLHVHPTEEVDTNWRGGPDISFKTNFPKPGLYKAWGQFLHQGGVMMVYKIYHFFIIIKEFELIISNYIST
jgi:hypothetical protein